MTWWRRLREFDSRGLLFERVDGSLAYTPQGYVVNRWVFRGAFLVLLLFLLLSAWRYRDIGWRQTYFHCGQDNPFPCENPCYGEPDCGVGGVLQWVATIPPGEGFGRLPPPGYEFRVRVLWLLAVVLFLVAFVLNHWLYNRGRPVAFLFPKVEVSD